MKKAFFVLGFWLSVSLAQAEPLSSLVPALAIPAKIPAVAIPVPLERVERKQIVILDVIPQVAPEASQAKKARWDFFDFRIFA